MKKLLVATLVVLSFSFVKAEEVNVGVGKVDTEKNVETTISIKKGAQPVLQNAKKYEMHEGTDDVAGDKAPLKKTAELNWKKACKEWMVEFKETNKSNQVISYNCGKMNCTKEGVESTCSSTAKYKIKTLIQE